MRRTMTHDELLAKLNNLPEVIGLAEFKARHDALRAVVELHKPKEEDGKLWCEHEVCYNHIEFLERDDCDCSYPCPTIQAIEKELG
jgi:hypothetical protein